MYRIAHFDEISEYLIMYIRLGHIFINEVLLYYMFISLGQILYNYT